MSSALLLPQQLQPIEVALPTGDAAVIEAVGLELTGRAKQDADRCFGYFPALRDSEGIETSLPACENFAGANPNIQIGDRRLNFNFLRRSLIQQKGFAAFHIDTDAATAVTGDIETIHERRVWRLLINLSSDIPRVFMYSDIDPDSLDIDSSEGYLFYDKDIDPGNIKRITLPPQTDTTTSGVLFCSNRVLHSGQDDKHGHFVAGYGCEEAA